MSAQQTVVAQRLERERVAAQEVQVMDPATWDPLRNTTAAGGGDTGVPRPQPQPPQAQTEVALPAAMADPGPAAAPVGAAPVAEQGPAPAPAPAPVPAPVLPTTAPSEPASGLTQVLSALLR